MPHDASKVKLGSIGSSAKVVTAFDSDPASFPAGVAVSMGTDGKLSLLKSAGQRVGISIGKSLSDHKKTAVARSGESVPVRLNLVAASGVATVSSYANLLTTTPDTVTVGATVFTAQAGAATPGTATFQAATSNDATGASLAAQINAHAVAGALVRAVNVSGAVTITARAGGLAGNDIVLAYTDNGGGNIGIVISSVTGGKLDGGSDTIGDIGYVTKGAKVYINDVSGKADSSGSGATISDAVYRSGVLTGVSEDGLSSFPCAYVDMPGGL